RRHRRRAGHRPDVSAGAVPGRRRPADDGVRRRRRAAALALPRPYRGRFRRLGGAGPGERGVRRRGAARHRRRLRGLLRSAAVQGRQGGGAGDGHRAGRQGHYRAAGAAGPDGHSRHGAAAAALARQGKERIGVARGRILLLVWVLVLWAWDGPGAAASPQAGSDRLLREAVEEQLRLLDTRALDELLAGLDDDLRRRLPAAGLRDVLLDPQGGLRLNPVELALEMLRYLLQEVLVQSRLLGQLVVLAVLCGLLHNLAGSLSKAATEFGFLAAYLVVIFIGLQSFSLAADIGRGTLATMSGFMLSLLPLLATMLAAVGAVSSAALFHPLLVTSVTLVVNLIERVVFPLLFLAAALGVVGRIATEFPRTRIAGLFRQGAVTALGFFFTLFLGVMVIRGAIAPVADGVALRAGK